MEHFCLYTLVSSPFRFSSLSSFSSFSSFSSSSSSSPLQVLGGSSVHGIAAGPLVDNLWVLCALSPAVGLLLAELLSFQADSDFQILPQPHVHHHHHHHPSFKRSASSSPSSLTNSMVKIAPTSLEEGSSGGGGSFKENGGGGSGGGGSFRENAKSSGLMTFGTARLLLGHSAVVLAVVPADRTTEIVFAPPDNRVG